MQTILKAVALLVLVTLLVWISLGNQRIFSSDFTAFYIAGKMAADSHISTVYDLARQRSYQQSVLGHVGVPFLSPPVVAHGFSWVRWLNYSQAFVLWSVLSICLYLGSIWMLWRRLDFKSSVLDPMLCSLFFFPLLMLLLNGQIDSVLLLAAVIAIALIKADRPTLAGFVLSIWIIKFHLLLTLVLCLVFLEEWKLVRACVAGTLLITSLMLALYGCPFLLQYVLFLSMSRPGGTWGINPQMMPNLRGLVYLLSGRQTPLLVAAALGIPTCAMCRYMVPFRLGRIAVIFPVSVIASYHSNMHDLVLALIPAVVLIRDVAKPSLRFAGWVLVMSLCFALAFLFRAGALSVVVLLVSVALLRYRLPVLSLSRS